MLYGILLGRWICGFLCPFGLIQDLLYKIKTPKLKKNKVTKILSYFKYVILVLFVFIFPIAYMLKDFPLPAFCKYICPAGTLEGAIGLLSNAINESKLSMLGPLFTWKFVLMISFDNSMNILGIDEVYKLPYSSGGVKPAGFLKSAVKRGASVAVTAFNHPSGPLFPLPSEMQTVKMLESAFEDAGIFLAEQYLISGDKYLGIMQHLEFAFAQRTPEISDFLKSKASLPKNLDCSYAFSSELQGDSDASAAVLGQILKYTKTENPVAMAEKLMAHFGSLRAVFEADFGALASVSADERVCFMIRLSAAIFARSLTEPVKVGKKCADDALRRFAVGVFFAMPYEETHIFCFDKEGRFLGESRVSEGTINSSEILPRRILDTAYAFGADSIILAHNHPRGHTSPSNADRDTTEYIASFLAPLGITLKAHYIVADGTAENFL